MENKELRENFEKELSEPIAEGQKILPLVGNQEKLANFIEAYQLWYSRALPILRNFLPERASEFERMYDPGRSQDMPSSHNRPDHYGIKDYIYDFQAYKAGDLVYTRISQITSSKFLAQISILQSILPRLDSFLANVRILLQAQLFDSEIASARELLENGYLRPAGTVAGVVLERHLANVCLAHGISLAKPNPSISDYNEALKQAKVYDVSVWRRIQGLGDIRNLCAHSKEREPTPEEVITLVEGAENIAKTVS